MKALINPMRIEDIFKDCLFKDGEDTSSHVAVEGITLNAGLNPSKLSEHKEEIFENLKNLPSSFMSSGGGGMTFLNACIDKNGNEWTSLHRNMELLFILGIATKQDGYCAPRDMWEAFPGGMPYCVVFDNLENKPKVEKAVTK